MDKDMIERVAQAMHEAMRHSPFFRMFPIRIPWEDVHSAAKSEYRAVVHSCLVAAQTRKVWIVTDESRVEGDEKNSSVIAVGNSREEVIETLADAYDGAEECVWSGGEPYWTTTYGEYPWVMAELAIPWGN